VCGPCEESKPQMKSENKTLFSVPIIRDNTKVFCYNDSKKENDVEKRKTIKLQINMKKYKYHIQHESQNTIFSNSSLHCWITQKKEIQLNIFIFIVLMVLIDSRIDSHMIYYGSHFSLKTKRKTLISNSSFVGKNIAKCRLIIGNFVNNIHIRN
jgi:hypothetical protein